MQYASLIWLLGLLVALAASSELQLEPMEEGTTTHARTKRTLFLKKKILGAGLLGFGLGLAKGFVIQTDGISLRQDGEAGFN